MQWIGKNPHCQRLLNQFFLETLSSLWLYIKSQNGPIMIRTDEHMTPTNQLHEWWTPTGTPSQTDIIIAFLSFLTLSVLTISTSGSPSSISNCSLDLLKDMYYKHVVFLENLFYEFYVLWLTTIHFTINMFRLYVEEEETKSIIGYAISAMWDYVI